MRGAQLTSCKKDAIKMAKSTIWSSSETWALKLIPTTPEL